MKVNLAAALLFIAASVLSAGNPTGFRLRGENAGQKGWAYQGMDIHGRYVLSLQNQGAATLYKLGRDSMQRVSSFHLGSFGKFNHSNVASFGVERVAKGDPFPVVYVSHCHRKPYDGMKDVCYVERILPGLGASELVQTIHYDDTVGDFGYALQWVVDRTHGMLYGYGNTINNSDSLNRHRIIKFRLPSLSEGKLVILKPEDALEDYLIEDACGISFQVIGQGLYVKNGKLYMPTGLDTQKHPADLYIWDLRSHVMQVRSLSGSSTGEPEDCSFMGRRFFVQTQDGVFEVKGI
ncbi:MAG: hypothetical protein IJ222_05550 [Bacteroidales bacterium]|nr:hypothetical protein [Bacteroidales bacterium]